MIDPISRDWPPDLVDAVDRFKQGDLIAAPPLFYAADLNLPLLPWTVAERDAAKDSGEELEDGLVELAPESRPPFGLITTQTCDLSNRSQALFSVAPVFYTHKQDQRINLDAVLRLTPPRLELGGDQRLVVDLRVEVPIEKSVLLGRIPIEAFGDEAGYLDLAYKLGRRVARGAWSDGLIDALTVRSIRAFGEACEPADRAEQASRARRVETATFRVLLRCTDGTRLEPQQVQLLVIVDSEHALDTVREWYEEWWLVARDVLAGCDFGLLPCDFAVANAVDLRRVEQATPVRFEPRRAFK